MADELDDQMNETVRSVAALWAEVVILRSSIAALGLAMEELRDMLASGQLLNKDTTYG